MLTEYGLYWIGLIFITGVGIVAGIVAMFRQK